MTEPATVGTKICRKCLTMKHVLAFAADADNRRDGLRPECRDCGNDAAHSRRMAKPMRKRAAHGIAGP